MTAAVIAAHVRRAIAATLAARQPFAHLVIDEFLPAGIFTDAVAALARLPDFERPERGAEGGGARCERAILPLSAYLQSRQHSTDLDALDAINQALLSAAVVDACLAPFSEFTMRSGADARPRSQIILSRDYPPYAIGPHTDIPKRLASMILYLAPDPAPAEWGTSLFVPKQLGFTCTQGRHYDFDGFVPGPTVAFKANRALLFARSDCSFHGLLPIEPAEGPRETLLYEIVR